MQMTFVPKPSEIQRRWFLVDAADAVLGRLCTKVAWTLSGKGKPIYAPHTDVGDHVVVINAAKVKLTGRKLDKKLYIHHTGYPGGLKTEKAGDRKARRPELLIMDGVKGMLPKTKLGRAMFGKLRVYAGAEHPHAAQQPAPLSLAPRKKA